jgi:hypothetical protein
MHNENQLGHHYIYLFYLKKQEIVMSICEEIKVRVL